MNIDLEAVFAAAPSPFVLLDRDLRIIWVNAAYLEVTGRARAEIVGQILSEAFPAPEDSVSDRMLRGSFRRVLASGRIDHLPLIPYPIRDAAGVEVTRYWSATHTPITDAAGQVQFILQNTYDVSDLYRNSAGTAPAHQALLLHRAEAVSRENLALGTLTEFFRAVFDQSPSFIAITNGPDHVFQIANQAFVQVIGQRELVGRSVREALPELEGQGFFDLLDQAYRSGEAITLRGVPAMLQREAGAAPVQIHVDFTYQPLRNADGVSMGLIIEGHDVTSQKQAEQDLIASRERFHSMAQTMPNHVWTATAAGGLDWLNDRIYDYTGAAEGDLYGEDWGKVVHPEDLPRVAENWGAAVAQGQRYEAEFRIRGADGHHRWHLVRAAPLHDAAGQVVRWVGTNTDIEDRKLAEAAIAELNATLEDRVAERNRELEDLHATLRQSQKMEAIGNLAGGIAHDFNNLLQTITGNLQLALRETPKGSALAARLEQAMGAVMRGATLSSQLLSFGRRQPLAPRVINLGRLLRGTDSIIRSAIGEGVEVETIVAGGLWTTHVDPTNVESALLNLAINARDAMNGKGKLTIEVGNAFLDDAYARANADVQPGQYVMIAVSDTGCGIPREILERVFDPFFTTKPEGKGTGLGLSMVYGFVKQSGGHVKIYSEPGSGTAIKLYLPRSHEAEEVIAPMQGDALTRGNETILLVEDDEAVRATAAQLLADLGYTVLQARDADRAMVVIESGARIDLLFTDVVMPGQLTSREMAERARAMNPDLPVLFTSGYTQNSIVHGGRLDPGVQLLSKPYTQEALAQKIRAVLERTPASAPVDAASANVAPQSETAPDPVTLFAGVRVLVCEDDPLIRYGIVEGLQDAGCQIAEAASGAAALALLAAQPFDLLFLDVGLPDQPGTCVARQARKQAPDLPILFATGDLDVPEAAELGRCQVLSKPFHDAMMYRAIAQLLQRPSP